jgi:hypothetical protein
MLFFLADASLPRFGGFQRRRAIRSIPINQLADFAAAGVRGDRIHSVLGHRCMDHGA